jgi:RNA polymerase sigma-70 factor (sigma-E family)
VGHQLWGRAALGVEAGFVEFAAARGAALFRTALLLCGDWHLAEDLVQETLGRLYPRWSKVARADQPAAYAHKVLIRVFLTQRRRRSSREQPTAGLDRIAGSVEDADVSLRVTLLDALGRLDRKDRAVLVLRYWEDLDAPTTAALVGMTPAAVRTRSVRALARLRELLGESLADLLAR